MSEKTTTVSILHILRMVILGAVTSNALSGNVEVAIAGIAIYLASYELNKNKK